MRSSIGKQQSSCLIFTSNHQAAGGLSGAVKQMFGSKEVSKQLEKDLVAAFSDEEMVNICNFLRHQNLVFVEPPPICRAKVIRESGLHAYACRHCSSANLVVTYGRYGYYFKCGECGGNTPIDFNCRTCDHKARIQKQGNEFRRVCGCGANELFFTNPL